MVQYKGKKSRKYVINFNKSKINNANQIEMIGPAPAIEIFLRMTAPHQCSRVSIFVIIFNGVPPGLKYHHAKRYRKLRWPTSQPASRTHSRLACCLHNLSKRFDTENFNYDLK